jgi:hypothetical protein
LIGATGPPQQRCRFALLDHERLLFVVFVLLPIGSSRPTLFSETPSILDIPFGSPHDAPTKRAYEGEQSALATAHTDFAPMGFAFDNPGEVRDMAEKRERKPRYGL